MRNRNFRWSILLTCFFMMITVASCSDDTPKTDGQNDIWRENLKGVKVMVSNGNQPPLGLAYDNFGFHVMVRDKNGEDMLDPNNRQNLADSDFYFEHDGKQYRLGDTMELCGSSREIAIGRHYSGYGYVLIACTKGWDESFVSSEPIDYTIDFVWPSRNIRKTLRTYVEFNHNALEEIEEARKTLGDGETAGIEVYKIGRWVDGQPLTPAIHDYVTVEIE